MRKGYQGGRGRGPAPLAVHLPKAPSAGGLYFNQQGGQKRGKIARICVGHRQWGHRSGELQARPSSPTPLVSCPHPRPPPQVNQVLVLAIIPPRSKSEACGSKAACIKSMRRRMDARPGIGISGARACTFQACRGISTRWPAKLCATTAATSTHSAHTIFRSTS